MAAAVVIVAVIRRPRAVLRLVPFVLGAAVGTVPRLILWLGAGAGTLTTHAFNFAPRLLDLAAVPGILAGLWDGPLLYLRFTGLEPSILVPITTLTIIAAIVVRVVGVVGGARFHAVELLPPLALTIAVGIIVMITPAFSLRYFELPTALLVVTIARLFSRGLEGSPTTIKAAMALVITFACGWHLVGQDYWLNKPHLDGRNACVVFPLGRRLSETSCHFTDVTDLYSYLIDRNAFDVTAPTFIAWPLEALDNSKFRLLTFHPVREGIPTGRRAALVVYNAPKAAGISGPDLRQARSVAGLVRQADSPRNFIVFMN